MADTSRQNSLFALSPIEKMSVIATTVLALVAIAIAWITYAMRIPFAVAVSVGCIGGLIHELFQSGGKVLFFSKKEDGLYLGSLAGMLLGGVSGLLSAHGVAPIDGPQLQGLVYDAFLAGVGMKGLAEAATGSAISKTDSASASAPKILAPLPVAPANVPPPSF